MLGFYGLPDGIEYWNRLATFHRQHARVILEGAARVGDAMARTLMFEAGEQRFSGADIRRCTFLVLLVFGWTGDKLLVDAMPTPAPRERSPSRGSSAPQSGRDRPTRNSVSCRGMVSQRRAPHWRERARTFASPCHAEGRGFESLHPLPKPPEIGGFCLRIGDVCPRGVPECTIEICPRWRNDPVRNPRPPALQATSSVIGQATPWRRSAVVEGCACFADGVVDADVGCGGVGEPVEDEAR